MRPAALVLVVAASLSACGGASAGDGSATPAAPTSAPTEAPTTAAPTTAAPTTAASATTPTTAAPEAGGFAAAVLVDRLFATRRQLRLDLRRVGPGTATVETIRLDSDRFEPVAANRRDSPLGTGRRVAMPLDYGLPRCDAADGAAVAVLAVTGQGEVRVPLGGDSLADLAALHARECRAVAVTEALELRLVLAGPASADFGLDGTLELRQRTPGTAAVVEALKGSVIFTLDHAGQAGDVLAVDDDDPAASLPVTVTASRCDPHALIESKNTFRFTARLALDGGEAEPFTFVPDGETRRLLEAVLADCLP